MATLLRRCSSRGYVATTLRVDATMRVAATLRCYAWLQRCGATTRVVAAQHVADDVLALQLAWLQRCDTAAL